MKKELVRKNRCVPLFSNRKNEKKHRNSPAQINDKRKIQRFDKLKQFTKKKIQQKH